MAIDRYSFQKIIKSNSVGKPIQKISSFPAIDLRELQSPNDIFVKLSYGQRIDNLAYKYLGDGKYWWVICLINGLSTPFDSSIIVGKVIRIPTNINKIIQIISSRAINA